MPEDLPHPALADIRIDRVLHALADPVRLTMVRQLATLPEGVACGAIDLPISKSTRTHHLRTLREAGVVTVRPSGTSRITTLRRADLNTLYPGLLDGILNAPH
ncbi:ArsR/SmtB family transcription factor [Actinokineospora globicatena]|uniref:Transcriptional regulator n=1 Tax=Actinokineospora globicatena TaxID=103729 RepID=A0A9W6QKG9_9PSEU|nr:helix-turn-helix transcriptional regulator [Actinokineospora globicatena]MCP2302773.1 transcriptional regulator, ArsR family [Actinokineospora globicatena]GLW75537.1 transcriptional regulator [Actinokineospora globicatena]GLW82378.1 transcriptional regulator [Actinokineospora globicatena]GLW91320.1 transcriptional regulator [Actinokineospora globicatena]